MIDHTLDLLIATGFGFAVGYTLSMLVRYG
jgi:hypothetical protein